MASEIPMREYKQTAVVLPVGPNDAESAFDTLASALYYLNQSRTLSSLLMTQAVISTSVSGRKSYRLI